jgi:hypothetical protein
MFSNQDSFSENDILAIFIGIAKSTQHNAILNERYVHHKFSHLLQERFPELNLSKEKKEILLHPEWPTSKKKTGLHFILYKNINGCFFPSSKGKPGFIDFTIGDYKLPAIGIEVTLKDTWSHEELVFDYLKLLDKRIPFKTVFSFNVIIRKQKLSKGKHLSNLEKRIQESYNEAIKRLQNNLCDKERTVHLMITEIGSDNKRRHWHYDKISGLFKIDFLPQ